jgi:hypothetical protein
MTRKSQEHTGGREKSTCIYAMGTQAGLLVTKSGRVDAPGWTALGTRYEETCGDVRIVREVV